LLFYISRIPDVNDQLIDR